MLMWYNNYGCFHYHKISVTINIIFTIITKILYYNALPSVINSTISLKSVVCYTHCISLAIRTNIGRCPLRIRLHMQRAPPYLICISCFSEAPPNLRPSTHNGFNLYQAIARKGDSHTHSKEREESTQ